MAARVRLNSMKSDMFTDFVFFYSLPLDCVLLVISELLPKIREIQASRKAASTTFAVDFLANATLTHVLPPAPPILARKFAVRVTFRSFQCKFSNRHKSVVRGIYRMADIVDLGRNICSGNVTLRYMERYKRSVVLCQTCSNATKAAF